MKLKHILYTGSFYKVVQSAKELKTVQSNFVELEGWVIETIEREQKF